MSTATKSNSGQTVDLIQPFLPLDESLYALGDVEKAFFKELTGIQDEDELKQHIITVQAKAYSVYGYPCIRRFAFATLKISRLHGYTSVQRLRVERPDAILLDMGCCFGNDIRKAVLDGWPVENAIASDLRPEFWTYGHELFKSTPATFPAVFIGGDAFDSTFLSPHPIFSSSSPPTNPRPNSLKDVGTLTQLQGHISAIHASAFFHLFDEPKQLELAERMASLLSPLAGSIIFGSHVGKPEKGHRPESLRGGAHRMFCHSPESWIELWDGKVFPKGTVNVQARLVEVSRPDFALAPGVKFYLLSWSVTRL
ncbi:hypothetical protein BDN72DRAFT_559978 [Pluteus cervinus]|uniref:Uncharacterized protein n=1 Tax=Pluteus cervinus TaxID=181527 RepID=A0ACD3BAQ3_9AGAR|nr:hypothetical protein BDN72DRAFT_559978 [Pluteus cervinus]